MSEYLSEEEQLERLRSFWVTWGLWILAGILLVVGGYIGWNWYQGHSREQAEKSASLYQDWLDAGTDADKSAQALKALEAAASGGSYHGFVLLKQAAEAVQAGKLEEAEPLLRQVAEKSDEPLLRSLASIRLAAVLQGLDRGDDALKLLDRVTGAGFKMAALEMKGDIHMARGERAEAHAAYKAAFDALKDGQKDSLLEAKVANAAPGTGEKAAAGKSADQSADEKAADEAGAADTVEGKAEDSGDAAPDTAGDAESATATESSSPAEDAANSSTEGEAKTEGPGEAQREEAKPEEVTHE